MTYFKRKSIHQSLRYRDNFLSFVTMIVLVFTIVIFFSPYGYRAEESNVIDFDRILTEVVIKRFEASGIEIPNQVGLLKYTCFAIFPKVIASYYNYLL